MSLELNFLANRYPKLEAKKATYHYSGGCFESQKSLVNIGKPNYQDNFPNFFTSRMPPFIFFPLHHDD